MDKIEAKKVEPESLSEKSDKLQSDGVEAPGQKAAQAETRATATTKLPELEIVDEANRLSSLKKLGTADNFEGAKKRFEEAICRTDRIGADAVFVEKIRQSRELIEDQPGLEKARELMFQKEKAPGDIRWQYGLLLNAWGHENKDQKAKERAIAVLEDIKVVDPRFFAYKPEALAVINQAKADKRIDLKNLADYYPPPPYSSQTKAAVMAGVEELIYKRPTGDRLKSLVASLAFEYAGNDSGTEHLIAKEIKMLPSRYADLVRTAADEAREMASQAKLRARAKLEQK